MKMNVLLSLCFVFMVGCAGRQKQEVTDHSADKSPGTPQMTVPAAPITPAEYEVPDFNIFYTKDLAASSLDSLVTMKTEQKSYSSDSYYLTLLVFNPTDTPLDIGRDWRIQTWNGTEWVFAKQKYNLMCFDDALASQKTHVCYAFKFPMGAYFHLPKGKYRILKNFRQDGRLLELSADFNIK